MLPYGAGMGSAVSRAYTAASTLHADIVSPVSQDIPVERDSVVTLVSIFAYTVPDAMARLALSVLHVGLV